MNTPVASRSGPGAKLVHELDWNLLRTFLIITEARSISRAAGVLHRTQPAISTALKRLESQVGSQLIVRSSTQFELTHTGALLARECREVFNAIGHIPSLLAEDNKSLSGVVSVTMASHLVSDIFDETFSQVALRYPALTLDISLLTSAEVIAGVRNRSISVGICLASSQLPDLNYFHLYTEHFGFFCGPSHKLFRRHDLTLSALAGERAVSFKAFMKSEVAQTLYEMHRKARLAMPFIGVSDHLEELRRMIVAGMGIGALPIHIMLRDVKDGILWPLLHATAATAIDVYLVTNPNSRLTRAELAFTELLTEVTNRRSLAERTYP